MIAVVHWTPPPPPPGPPVRRRLDRAAAVRAFLDRQPVWATHVRIEHVRAILDGA